MKIYGNAVGHPLPDPRKGMTMSGPINMNGQAINGLNAPTADDEAVNWGSVKDLGKVSSATVTLTAAGWVNNLQTVNVEGLTTDAAVAVSADPSDHAAYAEAGVYCYEQGNGTLTFKCEDVPAISLSVNVVILGVAAYPPRNNIGNYDLKDIGRKIISGEFNRIILLGDSITDGYGGTGYNGSQSNVKSTNTAGYCWANMFKKYVGDKYNVDVERYGYYGSIAEEQYNHIKDVASSDDLVIWLSGTNNRNNETRFASYDENIVRYVNDIKQKGAAVLLIPCIPSTANDEVSRYKTTRDINEVAFKNVYGNTYYLDMYSAFCEYCEMEGLSIDTMMYDGLHPNDNGYLRTFMILCRAIGLPLSHSTDFSSSGVAWVGTEPLEDTVAAHDKNVGGVFVVDHVVPVGKIEKVKVAAQKAGTYNLYFAKKDNDTTYTINKVVPLSVVAGVNEIDVDIDISEPSRVVATEENSTYAWGVYEPQTIYQLSGLSNRPLAVGDVGTYQANTDGITIAVWLKMRSPI